MTVRASIIIGFSLLAGLIGLGYLLGDSLIKFKELDRTVYVKGLAEKEVKADIILWPIRYLRASNDLASLYADLEEDTRKIRMFLSDMGFSEKEISVTAPAVTDKMAQGYGDAQRIKFRYAATQILTLYSTQINTARKSMNEITKLGKSGIGFSPDNYENKTEYIFTGLNKIKPQMIEEATRNARKTAQKFAEDSKSTLGKIKTARQGQFTIMSRDRNTPYIKKVRIVSTVEYYLSD